MGLLIFGCFTRKGLIMAQGSIADCNLRNNIIKRFSAHDLDESWYGPYIGKKYTSREYDGKRILLIDAAWWYDSSRSNWIPSNIFWTMARFGCYSDIVEKDDGYQTEKPQSPFKKLKKSIDVFYANGGRDLANNRIGLPVGMKDTISVWSNVEKDELGVISRLENTFKKLNLDLDKDSIAFHRFLVRPFEEPLMFALEYENNDENPNEQIDLKKRILQIARKDAEKNCEILDDVLRICRPDMVIFDCFQSMLNVEMMLKLTSGLSLYEYMHSFNASFFGLHNLFLDNPVYWSRRHVRINDKNVISVVDKIGRDEFFLDVDHLRFSLEMLFGGGGDNSLFEGPRTLKVSELGNDDGAPFYISKISVLAELLSEGLVDGIEKDIDEFIAGLTDDEYDLLIQIIADYAIVKLGPPVEELMEGVNAGAFKYDGFCLNIEHSEYSELEEFLIEELKCHGNYEQKVLLKIQENILNDPTCQDPDILHRSLSCLNKKLLSAIQNQQQLSHKSRIGSFTKPSGIDGVAYRTKAARNAISLKR